MIVEGSISQVVENVVKMTPIAINKVTSIFVRFQVMSATEHGVEERRVRFVPECGDRRRKFVSSDT